MKEKQTQETTAPISGQAQSDMKKTWSKPTVTEISRFSILSTAPTVSTTEGATFRAKSA
jgi:hypothetical protein